MVWIFCIFSCMGVFMGIFSPASRHLGIALIRQTATKPARPASREACRRAAVKPRPSCMSPEQPARLWRAVRGAGRSRARRKAGCPVGNPVCLRRLASFQIEFEKSTVVQWTQPPQAVSEPAAVNRNEDLTRQCQRRRLRLRDTAPAKPARPAEPRGLLPSGGKTRPSCMPRYAPARLRRAVRGQGAQPLAQPRRGGSSRMSLRPKCSRKRSVVA